jgi:hypothetical protein
MTRRTLAVACCVLLSATSMLAQPSREKADPISGTWTGEFVPPNATSGIAVTLELKFDGKNAVSGTLTGLQSPGNVKSGTFDPKTGALKLELGKTDDPAVLLVLEGTVAKGAASGRVTGQDGIGEFKIAKKE